MTDDSYYYLLCWYLVRARQSGGDPSENHNSSGRQAELHSETPYKSHPGWEEEQTESPLQEWQWNISGPILQFMEEIRVHNK